MRTILDIERTLDPERRIAELEREVVKLRKINAALMDRVERSMDAQGSAFSLFQTAIVLETKVRERTAELEQTLSKLEAGGGSSGAALEEAKARLSALSIQVGTVAATGPGVTLTVEDPGSSVGSEVLLDLIQELPNRALHIGNVR